jgi:hypothetical protein
LTLTPRENPAALFLFFSNFFATAENSLSSNGLKSFKNIKHNLQDVPHALEEPEISA